MRHLPVMAAEAIAFLACRPGALILDCTLAEGGHALEILKRITPGGKLIGLDRDPEVLAVARARLREYQDNIVIRRLSFSEIASWKEEEGFAGIDGALFDLGLSSFQLDDPRRGFSFRFDGPLDMRMDLDRGLTAAELVNRLPVSELEEIFFQYGQERWSKRISRAIVRARSRTAIHTTGELARIVAAAVPGRGRIHPATRVFQALRIAVNRELEELEEGLSAAFSLLRSGGRLVVISFHSLEDGKVKRFFRRREREDCLGRVLTPKPLTPSREERRSNPRSRSAKLRAIEHN